MHCHPTALSKDNFFPLSKKLSKVEKELDLLVAEFFTIQETNRDTADRILIGLILIILE
jgi:tetrahydromethanopterin S-methyltransferase subunit G